MFRLWPGPPTTATLFYGLFAMPGFSPSQLALESEMIDLVATTSGSSSSMASGHPTRPIDLTQPDPVPSSSRDHMHTVVALLRPSTTDLTQRTSDDRRKGRVTAYIGSQRRKAQSPLSQSNNIKTEQAHGSVNSVPPQRYYQGTEEPSMSNITLAWSRAHRSDTPAVDQQKTRKSRGKSFKPFPFMDFPPEIRNCVYKMLLTTPKTPIEFPEPTGRNRALRAANWEKCTTWKMRRKHKTIFLEILQVSKQLHAEASGIFYGCNVFKYRSDGTYSV